MSFYDVEVSGSIAKLHEDQIAHYGLSCAKIFMDYKVYIEKKVKILMVHLARWYEQKTNLSTEVISNMLIEKYKQFCSQLEPNLDVFYNELSNILTPPKPIQSTVSLISEAANEDGLEEETLMEKKEELQTLENQYKIEKYYLDALKRRMTALKTCQQLKKKIEIAIKTYDLDTKFKRIELSNPARKEAVDKLLSIAGKDVFMTLINDGQYERVQQ
ncbi:uncharacterized protein [Euwallacea similis]|uniref:uncharacterized protein n=1 Tax=Euwallacea similis TaxID=1736056 RepID=UPI00344B7D4C